MVPARYADRVAATRGDARLFQRGADWYVALPVRVPPTPTGCSGEEPTFIGVDLGIVRHAVVVAPGQVVFFDGQADRWRREHRAALRRRYQRHRRTDRVKEQRGKERRWLRDRNHQISRRIVDLAVHYPHPVIVLERLEGIRYRAKGGKRFNRMLAAWTFRELVDMIRYKAARRGIPVVLADPRNTSKTCPECGHATCANRPAQGRFRCVRCGYQGNADYVVARNIAAAGPMDLAHGRSDTARPATAGQAGNGGSRLDGVQVWASAHTDPNLASLASRTPAL
jgi:IS605 OrfB family transposase